MPDAEDGKPGRAQMSYKIGSKRKMDHFDDMSLHAIAYLEQHNGVSDITLQGPVECTPHQVEDWEEKNQIALPNDYKDFLQITNEMYVKYGRVLSLA